MVGAFLFTGRSVALQDGVLIAAEGQSRLHVLDPRNGQILTQHNVPNGLAMPSRVIT